jgi:hypothetical protein
LWNHGFVHATWVKEGKVLECVSRLLAERCVVLSRREKKAQGLEQHKKLMREKDLKRKQKRQVSLPAKHKK